MSKHAKPAKGATKPARKDWPLVVYVWIVGLGFMSYLTARIALDGQPHPLHWASGLVGAALGAAFVGSLLPDIDHDDAKLRHMTGTERGSLGGCLIAPLVGLLGGHRALTHTLIAWFVVSLPAIWLYFSTLMIGLVSSPDVAKALAALAAWRGAALALSIGYLSHLLADAMTMSGVPLWWPVGEKRVHVLPPGLRLRTGSLAEYAMLMVVGAVIGIAFVRF